MEIFKDKSSFYNLSLEYNNPLIHCLSLLPFLSPFFSLSFCLSLSFLLPPSLSIFLCPYLSPSFSLSHSIALFPPLLCFPVSHSFFLLLSFLPSTSLYHVSLPHTLTPSFFLSYLLFSPQSLSLFHSLSFFSSIPLFFFLSLSLSHSFFLSFSLLFSVSPSPSHSFTLFNPPPFSLFISSSLFLSLSLNSNAVWLGTLFRMAANLSTDALLTLHSCARLFCVGFFLEVTPPPLAKGQSPEATSRDLEFLLCCYDGVLAGKVYFHYVCNFPWNQQRCKGTFCGRGL